MPNYKFLLNDVKYKVKYLNGVLIKYSKVRFLLRIKNFLINYINTEYIGKEYYFKSFHF